MTRSEYQELVEFLGPKFDAIDRRFDAIEDRLTRLEVAQERDRSLFKAVGEGVTNVHERLDRFQEEVASEFRAVRSEMSAGFSSVWGEFHTVRKEMSRGFKEQSALIERLDARVGHLDDRVGDLDARFGRGDARLN